MDLNAQLEAAVKIAEQAGEVAAAYFRSATIDTRDKGDRDVVTAGDFAAEEMIRERLRTQFPGDGVVGEEGTDVPASTGRRWYIDPIDGTLNFSRELPIWCVSMALFDEQGPLLGVIRDPNRDDTFMAGRGLGAYLNGQRLKTSGIEDPGKALVHVTIDFHEGSMAAGLADIAALTPAILRSRNIGSAALALAYVAAGYFDAMVHRFAHTWDYGAGVLLVREAGGTVTDMRGAQYREETESVLAAAGAHLGTGLLDIMTNGSANSTQSRHE